MRDIFNRTALALGMSESLAPMVGQSVWHLCNRGFDGITHAIVFLLLNKKELTEIWSDPKYPLVNDERYWLCPFRTAMIAIHEILKAEETGSLESLEIVVPKPAAPFLCLPVLADALKQSNHAYKAVQITGAGVRIGMSDDGMVEVADTFDHEFRLIGTSKDAQVPMTITLSKTLETSGDGMDYSPKTRHTTLWLPTKRLNGDGGLNLE